MLKKNINDYAIDMTEAHIAQAKALLGKIATDPEPHSLETALRVAQIIATNRLSIEVGEFAEEVRLK